VGGPPGEASPAPAASESTACSERPAHRANGGAPEPADPVRAPSPCEAPSAPSAAHADDNIAGALPHAEGGAAAAGEARAPPVRCEVQQLTRPETAVAGALRAATWSWQTEEGVWREYEPDVCELVEQAFQMGQKAVCPSQQHVIVFHEMEQRLVEDAPPRPAVSPSDKSSAKSRETTSSHSASKRAAAAKGLAAAQNLTSSHRQDALPTGAQLARPVRRHMSCGRAEALVALRARNAHLRDGWWRAQQQQQHEVIDTRGRMEEDEYTYGTSIVLSRLLE
jgi:hypothetical protein